MNNVRPKFHITGETGWINDPNGLIKFNGEYHAFFQYYPYATHWGPMYWGHVKSKDLTRWERLPVALYPDEQDDGCFSGSAIEHEGKLYLMYTSFTEEKNGNPSVQVQALAVSSDGVNFKKLGIVIGKNDLPKEYSLSDFRDPKVFKKGNKFYCVLAAKRLNGNGRLLLYSSDDLFKWNFVTDLFKKDSGGRMTECPCYYDDLGLLCWSEDMPVLKRYEHLDNHSTFYEFGSLSDSGFITEGEGGTLDYGFDFYAPQIFGNEPVLIGWMYMFDRNVPYERFGFCGMLTVPRLFEKRDGRLWQTPVVNGCKETIFYGGKHKGKLKAGVLHIEVDNLKNLTAKLKQNGAYYACLTVSDGLLTFDRSHCKEKITGKERDEESSKGIRKMPVKITEHTVIDIVLDTFSTEIFVDGRALSAVTDSGANADGYELGVVADGCKLTVKEL